MVERLRAKPGSHDIRVTFGDVVTARADSTFRLAYLIHNTITNLTPQDDQVECFRNVPSHLEPGGCPVVEVGVPDVRRLLGETVRAFHVSPTYVAFDQDAAMTAQISYSHHSSWVVGHPFAGESTSPVSVWKDGVGFDPCARGPRLVQHLREVRRTPPCGHHLHDDVICIGSGVHVQVAELLAEISVGQLSPF